MEELYQSVADIALSSISLRDKLALLIPDLQNEQLASATKDAVYSLLKASMQDIQDKLDIVKKSI